MLTISICQASYKSGIQSVLVRDEWLKRAKLPSRVEHCLGFEENDHSVKSSYGIHEYKIKGKSSDNLTKFIVTKPQASPSNVRNWNSAASISTGDIILLIADDLIPESEWDIKIENFILENDYNSGIIKFTDDRCRSLSNMENDSLLPRHPGMFRDTYLKVGYVFDPRFNGTGPDLKLMINSLKFGQLLDARHIKLHHSIGPVLDKASNLICGCKNLSSGNMQPKRTIAQLRVHSQEIDKSIDRIKVKLSAYETILIRLMCISKLSNFIIKSMKPNKRNFLWIMIVKSYTLYFLSFILRIDLRSR